MFFVYIWDMILLLYYVVVICMFFQYDLNLVLSVDFYVLKNLYVGYL